MPRCKLSQSHQCCDDNNSAWQCKATGVDILGW